VCIRVSCNSREVWLYLNRSNRLVTREYSHVIARAYLACRDQHGRKDDAAQVLWHAINALEAAIHVCHAHTCPCTIYYNVIVVLCIGRCSHNERVNGSA
jgi:hypothetical protein